MSSDDRLFSVRGILTWMVAPAVVGFVAGFVGVLLARVL